MATLREGIISTAKAALTSVTGVSDSSVYRSRVSALKLAQHPAIVVEPVSDIAEIEAVGRIQWVLSFQAVVLVRADIPDLTADTIINDVHNKIMGSAALLALVTSIEPISVDWAFHDADTPLGVITMQFRCGYQTSTSNISSI